MNIEKTKKDLYAIIEQQCDIDIVKEHIDYNSTIDNFFNFINLKTTSFDFDFKIQENYTINFKITSPKTTQEDITNFTRCFIAEKKKGKGSDSFIIDYNNLEQYGFITYTNKETQEKIEYTLIPFDPLLSIITNNFLTIFANSIIEDNFNKYNKKKTL